MLAGLDLVDYTVVAMENETDPRCLLTALQCVQVSCTLIGALWVVVVATVMVCVVWLPWRVKHTRCLLTALHCVQARALIGLWEGPAVAVAGSAGTVVLGVPVSGTAQESFRHVQILVCHIRSSCHRI